MLNPVDIRYQRINGHGPFGEVLIRAFITHHHILDNIWILVCQFYGFVQLILSRRTVLGGLPNPEIYIEMGEILRDEGNQSQHTLFRSVGPDISKLLHDLAKVFAKLRIGDRWIVGPFRSLARLVVGAVIYSDNSAFGKTTALRHGKHDKPRSEKFAHNSYFHRFLRLFI